MNRHHQYNTKNLMGNKKKRELDIQLNTAITQLKKCQLTLQEINSLSQEIGDKKTELGAGITSTLISFFVSKIDSYRDFIVHQNQPNCVGTFFSHVHLVPKNKKRKYTCNK